MALGTALPLNCMLDLVCLLWAQSLRAGKIALMSIYCPYLAGEAEASISSVTSLFTTIDEFTFSCFDV